MNGTPVSHRASGGAESIRTLLEAEDLSRRAAVSLRSPSGLRFSDPTPSSPPAPTPRSKASPLETKHLQPIHVDESSISIIPSDTPHRLKPNKNSFSKIKKSKFTSNLNNCQQDSQQGRNLDESIRLMNEKIEFIQALKTKLKQVTDTWHAERRIKNQELDEVQQLSERVAEHTRQRITEAAAKLKKMKLRNGNLEEELKSLEKTKRELEQQLEIGQQGNSCLQRAVSRELKRTSELDEENVRLKAALDRSRRETMQQKSLATNTRQALESANNRLALMEKEIGNMARRISSKERELEREREQARSNGLKADSLQKEVLDLREKIAKERKEHEREMTSLREKHTQETSTITKQLQHDLANAKEQIKMQQEQEKQKFNSMLARHLEELRAKDNQSSITVAEAIERTRSTALGELREQMQTLREENERKLKEEQKNAHVRELRAKGNVEFLEKTVERLKTRVQSMEIEFQGKLQAERDLVCQLQKEIGEKTYAHSKIIDQIRSKAKDHEMELERRWGRDHQSMITRTLEDATRQHSMEVLALKSAQKSEREKHKNEKRLLHEALKTAQAALSSARERQFLMEQKWGSSEAAEEILSLRVRAGVMTKAAENARREAEDAVREAKLANLRAERAELDLQSERKTYATHLNSLSDKIQRQLSARKPRRRNRKESSSAGVALMMAHSNRDLAPRSQREEEDEDTF